MALQVQLIQAVTGLVIACVTPNFVNLVSPNPTSEAQLWHVVPTINDDNNFYLCNVQYPENCLGSYHKSIIDQEPLVAEEKARATDVQLTWHYDSTLGKIVSSYYLDKLFVIDTRSTNCKNLIFRENGDIPTQNFIMAPIG